MCTLARLMSRLGFPLLVFAAVLLPLPADAQAVLSVSPLSVTTTTTAGTNAPSRTVQVSNAGTGALKWTVAQSSANWLSVSPNKGTNSGTLTITFQTAALGVGQHQATFRVNSTNGTFATVTVVATITSAPPPTLVITCPANITTTSPDGNGVPVTFSATTTGGNPPVTVGYVPASGSTFPVGTTTVTATANSQDGQQKQCSFTVTVTFSQQPPTLVITCPANITTTSPDGNGVPVTFSATTTGGNPPVQLNYSPASGSIFPVGTTTVTVTATSGDGQMKTCGFSVTVTYTPTGTSPDGATTPPAASIVDASGAIWTIAPDRRILRNNVQASNGVGDLILWKSGAVYVKNSSYPDANGSWWQWLGSSWSQVADPTGGSPPPPPPSGVGPQSTITCPAGAVNIFPGSSINAAVDANVGATTFCLMAGTHNLDRSIIPKTGNTFVGEFGAILNGTWTSIDDTQAAFRTHNENVDNVTIKNLVIRNFRRGIHASAGNPVQADHWTIEFNEVGPNYSGVVFPSDSLVRNNFIHHNTALGYFGLYSHNSVFEFNEVSFNGWEQKITESNNVIVRNNFIHHNANGIWFDANNTAVQIYDNRLEDNSHVSIWYEISTGGEIRNNTIRRSGDAGVFISTSKNTTVHHNLFEDNFRGITYFVNCASVGGGVIGFDLANVSSFDNAINVSNNSASGSIAIVFSYAGACTPLQVEPYKFGQKALTFIHNAYDVVNPASNQSWYWDGFKFWNEWQNLGHDTTGTVQ
jgi:parallel beta-helix repeat protein